MGLTPFPCPAWALSPPGRGQGWGGGRWGASCGSVSALHPQHRFSAWLGFLHSRHASGRGGLQHMKERLPLIIRSDESLLGKK